MTKLKFINNNMITNTITTIKLVPEEGKFITQANLKEDEERVFSSAIYCPSGQEEFWSEVDSEYKTEWENSHKKEETEEDKPEVPKVEM